MLSRPADRFPELFGENEFLKKYPYFLPCAVPATFTIFIWMITFFFLEETLPNPTPVSQFLGLQTCRDTTPTGSQEAPNGNGVEKPLGLKSLLTYKVVIVAANYASLALVDVAFRAIHPVFLSTPIDMGGLGLSPPSIGKLLSSLGILNGIFQVCFFAKIHDRWGSKRVFIGGLVCSLPMFALFPVINLLARHQGYSFAVWAVVGVQIVISVGLNVSFGKVSF